MVDESVKPKSSGPPELEKVDRKALGRRARVGAVTLVARSVILQVLVFSGNLVLARVLDPKDFGVFSISQFALTFFIYFGDAGLGGGLVQQRETPDDRTLASVLWLQLLLSAAVIAVVWVVAPLSRLIWKDLPEGSEWVLRALSLELLLTAARTVPSLLMERELQFGRLSVLEVTNQLAFYAVALPLSFFGWGVRALVAGVLARATVGVTLAYALRPWRPRRVLDFELLRPIIRFGVPFQMKNVVGFIYGAALPFYAGRVLGVRAVGLIGWARTTAFAPLRLVEVMARVGFPLYSRLQGDPRALGETLGRSVHVCAAGTLMFAGLIFGLGPEIVHIAYPKWIEATVLLYLFTGTITIAFLTPLVAAAFDAMGRPKVFLRLSVVWTLLSWVLIPLATPRWGIVGFVVGFASPAIVGNLIVIVLVGQALPETRILKRVRGAALAASLEAIVGRVGIARVVHGPVTLVLGIIGCVLCFGAVLSVIDRPAFEEAMKLLRRGRPTTEPPNPVG